MNQLREASLRGRDLKAALPPTAPRALPGGLQSARAEIKAEGGCRTVSGETERTQRLATPPLQTARVAELSGTWPAVTQLLRPGAGLM